MTEQSLTLEESIRRDMAEISWAELKVKCPHEAIVMVQEHLDLIEVALAVAEDRSDLVAQWLENGGLKKLAEDDIAELDVQQPDFLGAYLTPFVLVQRLNASENSTTQ